MKYSDILDFPSAGRTLLYGLPVEVEVEVVVVVVVSCVYGWGYSPNTAV